MAGIQAIRGMNDILPEQTPLWMYVEDRVRSVLTAYGYQQIRMPVIEQTELFKRSIGEVTDIVEKEMYTFADRNGDSLTMRPEGTAGCVRAGLEHGLLFNQTRRLWYAGPMFRHERPQKGRYRQFHQVGVECFGMDGPDIDAELLMITWRLWRALGVDPYVHLQINTLGSNEVRARYRDALVGHLSAVRDALDDDSLRRLETNPLRILDSKVASTQALLASAPVLSDFLDDESRKHFETLCAYLTAAGVPFEVNPSLVRGLDYYTGAVFEWVTDRMGAQGTVCAGGRYDGLVQQLGGKSTPAVGFAMGVERLVLMLETLELIPPSVTQQADLYLCAIGEGTQQATFRLAEELRDALVGKVVVTHCGGGSLKNQLKRADRSGAAFALILGETELQRHQVICKSLRAEAPQTEVARADIISWLSHALTPST